MSDTATVWIVGAGFSRSLGGPLLADLLSMATREKLAARHQDLGKNSAFNQVYALYHLGRDFADGYLFDPGLPKLSGATYWGDAEQFLEIVSNAAQADPEIGGRDYLNGVWATLRPEINSKGAAGARYLSTPGLKDANLDFEVVANAARELVALECGLFLDPRYTSPFEPASVDPRQSERARPYVDWGDSLNENDTILSFNYDTVVEDIACRRGVTVLGVGDSEDIQGRPTLIKLHGSVDWSSTGDGYRRDRGSIARPPAIATPGNAKLEMSEGGFKPLWDEAAGRLREARHVAWLGYGLPASDASAVKLILDNLATNQYEDLTIDLVLGPTNFATDRILNLVGAVVSPKREARSEEHLAVLRKVEAAWSNDRETLKEARRVVTGDKRVFPEEHALAEKRLFIEGFIRKVEEVEESRLEAERATDRISDQVVQALPLYAQDYLRLWATRRQQILNHRRIAAEIAEAKQRLEQLRAYIDS